MNLMIQFWRKTLQIVYHWSTLDGSFLFLADFLWGTVFSFQKMYEFETSWSDILLTPIPLYASIWEFMNGYCSFPLTFCINVWNLICFTYFKKQVTLPCHIIDWGNALNGWSLILLGERLNSHRSVISVTCKLIKEVERINVLFYGLGNKTFRL
jgi:hypothetical protein